MTHDSAKPGAYHHMDSKPSFTEHYVPREQGRVYAREYAGVGPAFVLMHGFPDNLHIWDDLIPYLVASRRRVVTFDFLGFGASDKPSGATYDFKQQLGDLEAVAEGLGLGKIVPVAHDSSGVASINYALAHPEGVDSVIMLNSAYAEDATVLWPEMITLFASAWKALVPAEMRQTARLYLAGKIDQWYVKPDQSRSLLSVDKLCSSQPFPDTVVPYYPCFCFVHYVSRNAPEPPHP